MKKPKQTEVSSEVGRKWRLMLKNLYYLLELAAQYAIFIFDFIGVLILIWVGLKGIYNFLHKDSQTGLKLAQGMATSLQFKIGGEILRTVVIREVSEIFLVGGIIVLRIALMILIQWEIKNEKREASDTEEVIVKMERRSFVTVCREIFSGVQRSEEKPLPEPEKKEEWGKPTVVKRKVGGGE